MADNDEAEAKAKVAAPPAPASPGSSSQPHPVPISLPIPIPARDKGEDGGSAAGSEGSGSLLEGTGIITNLEAESGSEFNQTNSDAESIASSWTNSATSFRYEHGRRYHALDEKTYALPNDEQEMDRLELQHLIWSLLFNGRLALSPLTKDIKEALDIGTGTGAWAVEFATQYPDCQVLGTDLSPIQPDYVPLNCTFLIDDANSDWPSEFQNKFDYIHTRAVGMGIRDWDKFVDQAWASLKPGGWLELQEFHMPFGCDDGSLTESMPLHLWGETWQEAARKVGVDVADGRMHAERMRRKGFRHVREAKLKCPIGPWAKGRREKEIGILMLKDVAEHLTGLSYKMFSLVGHSKEMTEELCAGARADMMNPRVHTYMPVDLSWGQKPRRSGLRNLSSMAEALSEI